MIKLFVYIKDYKKECVLGPLFKLLEACFDLIVPIVMAMLIDEGIMKQNVPFIWKMGLVLLLLAAIGLTCSITAQYFAAKAAVGFATRLRYAVFAHIQSLSFREMDQIGTSTMLTRMTSDINQVQSGTNMALRLFLRSPFIVIGAAILAFTMDTKAAIIFVVVIPLLAAVVFGIMLITMPMYKKVQSFLDRLLGITRQNLSGVRVIRAFNKEKDQIKEFGEENRKLTQRQLFVGRISALMNPVTYIMINLALVVLLWTGAFRINVGTLSQGSMIALINYMTQILIELVKLANTIILTTKCVACGNRVQNLLEISGSMEQEKDFMPDMLSKRGRQMEKEAGITFNEVSMTYQNGGEPSLENISFTARQGQTIGIIGGTGSGKSSLVHLIPRFYDVTKGSVIINGDDVRGLAPEELRQKIGIVMQKAVLFHGTIRENMLWGKPDASDKEIREALVTAQAMDFIEQKDGELDFVIQQGGRNLSGGQKQRLTIARALVRKPEILILDDSASALDLATDAKLRKALQQLKYKPTVFIVSQRTSSIQHADQILVLDDGELTGMGTHEELLSSCEVYQEIYESQFKGQENAGA